MKNNRFLLGGALAVSALILAAALLWAGRAEPPSKSASAAEGEQSVRSADKIAYIRQGLRIYDLKSKYYDMVDGHAPGVDFKIRNVGDRTLSKVVVRVIFYDSEAKAIAEEDYTPVLSSKYISNDDAPLRPNYIWQQKSGQIFSAKSVPSEWKEGSVRASIVDIEFDSQ